MTKTIRNLIAAMLLIGASQGAVALNFYSGNTLLAACEIENNFEQAMCQGYLMAVNDTHYAATMWGGLEQFSCLQEGVMSNQLQKIWIKWANENPEKLHFEASGLVLNAYRKAFPCD
tara:strand:+ start:9955 stop:10305 length:351 start_codon:yes stop_codon:yes gene_type:complete